MKSPDQIRMEDALDDEAAAWLLEREEGFAAGREQAFVAWRDRDLRHAAAVTRVERALQLLDEMPAVRAPLEARFGRTADQSADLNVARRRWVRFGLSAAGLAAALVLGVATWRASAQRNAGERYATDATAQRHVALRDGSVIDVNVRSDVRVEFTERERRVTLDEGEAHFEVAHDTARPFIVTAGGVSVRAVGTAFNVRLAPGTVDVLVVEGKVEVTPVRPNASRDAAPAPQVAAGERTVVPRDEPGAMPKVERVTTAAIRESLAWQNPNVEFADVPLRELVRRFNRRNATQIVVTDPQLEQRRMGGVFGLDQIDAFVRLLEEDGDIVADRSIPNEIRLRRAR